MNTRFNVLASYNILQYLRDLIHVLIFISISKCQKKSQINEYSDTSWKLSIILKDFVAVFRVRGAPPPLFCGRVCFGS